MKHFTYKYQYIYSTPSQLNKFSVLTVYRVTIHNRCRKYPPPESMRDYTPLLFLNVAPFQRFLGGCEWFDRLKNASMNFLYISNWSF